MDEAKQIRLEMKVLVSMASGNNDVDLMTDKKRDTLIKDEIFRQMVGEFINSIMESSGDAKEIATSICAAFEFGYEYAHIEMVARVIVDLDNAGADFIKEQLSK